MAKQTIEVEGKIKDGALTGKAGYTVEALVDSDGHLNIYITPYDESEIVDCDTSNEGHYRFSTEKIEEVAREHGRL